MPINSFLPYVTAGVAFGDMTRKSTDGSDSLTQSATHTGWTIGGGVDFAYGDRWVIGGEVLYVDLDGKTYPSASGGFSEVTIGSQFTVVRVRAAFRFP
jgi:outer membrane immunogenic protein